MPDRTAVAPVPTSRTHAQPTFDALSDEQRRIVERLDGGLLALAPAGTGKTAVLTERVARALDRSIPPERILCLTFTNRAACELRSRIVERFPEHADRLVLRTFHHLCADILRREAKQIGLMVDFAVCDDHESIALLRRILRLAEDDAGEATRIYHRLQDVKAIWPAAALTWPLGPAWPRAGFDERRARQAAQRYERGLAQWHLVDFGDLVLDVRAIFAARPDVLERWANRFDLVQVDEIQDTHIAEYEVVATLARRSGNLALFGDLDQAIYEWRGASPNHVLRRFKREFGPIYEAQLTYNHRATRALIHAADTFAGSFASRTTTLSPADHCDAGEAIRLFIADNVSNEAAWIADQVAELAASGVAALPAIGVLAPVNWYCDEVARALARRDVPFVTAARVAFFRKPEIVEALGYLRLLLHPGATNDALRVWERSTRGLGHDVLNRIRQDGERLGLRLVDLFRLETFVAGEPLRPLLDAFTRGTIVIFDLETTGLDEGRDEIVEIAALRLTAGRTDGRFSTLVRPTIPVGESEHIHHLSDERLAREGRDPQEAISEFLAFAKGALLVGHNVGFDLRALAAQARRLGLPFEPPASADTFELARRFVAEEPHTLEALANRLNLPHRPAHRAAADVSTTADLLGYLVNQAQRGAGDRRSLVRRYGGPFEAIARQLDGWRALGPTMRPHALLARVLAESGQLDRVAGEPARCAALHELVALFEAEDDPRTAPAVALREALDRAALSTQVDHLLTAEARVPVLTIHQAKGLEFDVVFVAGCSDGDLPRRRSVAERRLEEERRLFYVALTRARRQLVLTRPAYSNAGTPKQPSRFLATLGPILEPV